MEKFRIPAHVIPPGNVKDFTPQASHAPTNSASIRYAALWALGVRDILPPTDLAFLEDWCRQHHLECPLFPNPNGLESQSFAQRIKDCPEAAQNVACYPGNKNRRTPSYAETYHLVWVEQKWPELCAVISKVAR
ncbi:hypothetical protein [Geobacter anodireducens]